MALGADTDVLFFAGGVDVPDFATGADDFRRAIRRMDGIFHFDLIYVGFVFDFRENCATLKQQSNFNIHPTLKNATSFRRILTDFLRREPLSASKGRNDDGRRDRDMRP